MYFALSWRNIWRNKKRSFITMASILFAFFFAVFVRSMQFGTYEVMIKNVVGIHTGYVQIHKKGFWKDQTIDHSFLEEGIDREQLLKKYPLKSVSPRMEGFGLVSHNESTRGVAVIGIDPRYEFSELANPEKIVSGKNIAMGGKGVLLAEGLANLLHVKVSDTLILIGQGYHGMSAVDKYSISGIIKLSNPQLNETFLVMPLSLAQEFYSAEKRLTALSLLPASGTSYKEIKAHLMQGIDSTRFEVLSWEEMLPELVQGIQADSAGGLIMLFILYVIITFGIFGTFIMLTNERKYELGILIAVGMGRLRLILVVGIEILLMTLMGIFTGSVLSWLVVYYFNQNPIRLTGQAAGAMKEYGMEPIIPTTLDWSIFVTHGGIILVISLLLALYPFLYIYRLKPVEALRG